MARFVDHGYAQRQSRTIKRIIRDELPQYLGDYFTRKLMQGVDEDGKQLPKKSPATVREYRKQGWDTVHWLIRTGRSTRIISKPTPNGVQLFPEGKDTLKDIKQANRWFTLTDKTRKIIIDYIKGKLR